MHVRMYVCMYVCIYGMYACMYMYVYVCMYIRLHLHVCPCNWELFDVSNTLLVDCSLILDLHMHNIIIPLGTHIRMQY